MSKIIYAEDLELYLNNFQNDYNKYGIKNISVIGAFDLVRHFITLFAKEDNRADTNTDPE